MLQSVAVHVAHVPAAMHACVDIASICHMHGKEIKGAQFFAGAFTAQVGANSTPWPPWPAVERRKPSHPWKFWTSKDFARSGMRGVGCV